MMKLVLVPVSIIISVTIFSATANCISTDSIISEPEEYTELEEIVVERRQNLIQSDGAKLTYNVDEDPEKGTANILDILRKVPGVIVDADDNVKVNGQSSFRILMNGHDNPMLKGDIKTVLKALPASSIKKIEVISEPGAKFEAEGSGGILNIVTDRTKSLTGTMAQISASISNRNLNGSINLKQKIRKVMLDASVRHYNSELFPYSIKTKSEIEDFTGALNHLQKIEETFETKSNYTGFNINLSWEPDTLNIFNLSADYGINKGRTSGFQTRNYLSSDQQILMDLLRKIVNNNDYNGFSIMTSYQHNFGKDDHFLVVSYQFDDAYFKNLKNYFLEYIIGSAEEKPFIDNSLRFNYLSHIIQVDYSCRFNPRHLLETGVKINLNNDGSNQYSAFGQSPEDAVIEEKQRVKMTQLKDIYAAYASYNCTLGKWNIKGGMRYEHTRMGIRYIFGNLADFTTRLNDIVPNGAVSLNLASATSLRLAYQMRISRPYVTSLNPFINSVTPGVISYGNPDLKSSRLHNLTLSYSNYQGVFSGQASLTYRYSGNDIEEIAFSKEGVINNTFANIGLSHQASLNLNGNWNASGKLQLSSYLSTTYMYLRSDSELLRQKNCGWQFYGNVNVNYTLPYDIRSSAYAGLWTPWISLQGKGDRTSYYYGIGLSRSWLKNNALTLQINASNFFPTHLTYSWWMSSSTFRSSKESRSLQCNVGLSLTYKFGALKSDFRRTAANIEKESGNNRNKGF